MIRLTIFFTIYFVIQSTLKIFTLREKFIEWAFRNLSVLYLATVAKNRTPWRVTIKELSEMPSNTLGYRLFSFLRNHHFQLQHKAENHDIFHIITDYMPTVKEEIGLQFILLGNGKRSLFMFMALIAGFVLMPEHFQFYKSSYEKGKKMRPFYQWDFEHLLEEDFRTLQGFIYYQLTFFKLEL